MTKWLVTGAAGFLGAHLCRRLVADGTEVVALDAFDPTYDPALKEARAEWVAAALGRPVVRCDVRDTDRMGGLFRRHRPEVVVHLAARAGVRPSQADPLGYLDVNVRGFAELLEHCTRGDVRHLVYASSSSVYGETTPRPFRVEAAADHPVSPYAATKRMNELQAHVASHLHGLPTTGLRFFTAYGPWGRPDMAYFGFAAAALEGRPVTVFGDGSARRDFTYVDDVVEVVRRVGDLPPAATGGWSADTHGLALSDAAWRLLNVGLGEPVSVAGLLDAIERRLGRPVLREYRPALPGEVSATEAEVSSLRDAVGVVPTTPLEQGLAHFLDWLVVYRSRDGASSLVDRATGSR